MVDMLWEIYYADAKYAERVGDPMIGIVRAATKEEAELKAHSEDWVDKKTARVQVSVGFWAVPVGQN